MEQKNRTLQKSCYLLTTRTTRIEKSFLSVFQNEDHFVENIGLSLFYNNDTIHKQMRDYIISFLLNDTIHYYYIHKQPFFINILIIHHKF